MRNSLFLALLIISLLSAASTRAQDSHAAEHGDEIFHAFRVDVGGGVSGSNTTNDWDLSGWVGTDENKAWLKSEGEHTDGKTERAEFWALYSRNVATFWDAQVGIRHDREPSSLTYLTFGIAGLAPLFFETEVHVFISEHGDFSARLRQENDFLVTQRLIIQPYIEATLNFQNVAARDIGSGLSNGEFGLQTRYEISRKFAPYLDLKYDRKFGRTASMARSRREDNDALVGTLGLRLMF